MKTIPEKDTMIFSSIFFDSAMLLWYFQGSCVQNPLGRFKFDSVQHPSEVYKMSAKNFWELSGKK